MQALLALVMIPLMLLNAFGGVAAGLWLALLGEWWALGVGLIAICSPFLLSIILAPGLLLLAPAGILLGKQRPFLAFPLLLLGYAYTCVVIAAWCILILIIFIARADADTFWPLLIWSYSVALGPWQYMAQKDEQAGAGDASTMTTLFAQVAYVVMAIFLVFSGPTLLELALVFGAVMFLGMLIQTGIGLTVWREQTRLGAL
jgi:hypothetical protein